MTLIATVIGKYGIIQASDSNLTRGDGHVKAGPKVFSLGFAHGAISFAGRYSVGPESMDSWLPGFIATYSASGPPSLRGFAESLAKELDSSALDNNHRFFHIAGYAQDADGAHPEFYFVRNAVGINSDTGAYEGVSDTYAVSEDFWGRDYRRVPCGMFASGGSQRYFNGFPPGRIGYLGGMNMLRLFFEGVWGNPQWRFRRPSSLNELAAFVRLEFEVINTLFASSDYPSPFIGGDIQVEAIAAPGDAVEL